MDLIKRELRVDERILNVVKPFLIFSGLWDEHLFESARKQTIYRYYSWFLQFSYLLCFALMLIDFILAVGNGQWTSSSAAIFLSYCEMMMKFVIFRKNKVSSFFGRIKSYEQKIWSLNNPRIARSYLEQVSLCKKINWCTIVMCNIVCCCFFIDGVNDDIESKKLGKEYNYRPYKKMYQVWLPFDVRDREPVVMAINLLIVISGVALYDSIVMILVTFSEFLASQLKVLQIQLSEMTSDQSNVNQYLKELILEHKYVIRSTKEFSYSVRYILLMEYLLNSVAVAAIAIQLLTAKTLGDYMFLVSFAIICYVHIFSLGWTANEVTIQSVNVADAVNRMNWYDQDSDFKRMVHMVMLRAQEPLIIEMGPFAAMTIQSALMSMKAAYSYLMVMKRF